MSKKFFDHKHVILLILLIITNSLTLIMCDELKYRNNLLEKEILSIYSEAKVGYVFKNGQFKKMFYDYKKYISDFENDDTNQYLKMDKKSINDFLIREIEKDDQHSFFNKTDQQPISKKSD